MTALASRPPGAARYAAAPALRFTGDLARLGRSERAALLDRAAADPGARLAGVRATVTEILARVRRDGDAALLALAREHDRVALETLEVPRPRLQQALAALDPGLRLALERAARNLAAFHRAQLPPPLVIETEPGIELGRRAEPLERVGVYAPGGRASYPSSVLMAAIPARAAGVKQIVLCSPPGADGLPPGVVLAAAEISRVDRVFAIGGAGAIGAMAFGTASVPRVDRIVGPGNAYVAEAKLAVSREVAIDSPAGPSEVLVVADAGCDPVRVARELLAQAEHDPLACVVAVACGSEVAAAIVAALGALLASDSAYIERRATIIEALAGQGAVLTAASLDEAVAFANDYAAEHVLLQVSDAAAALARIRNAGTVLVGDGASVAFGDYMTGANHVLPTGGHARAYSGLSTLDFVRWTTWQRMSAGAAARLANDVALFADAERLPAHAAAALAFATGTGAGGAAVSRSAGDARDDGRSPASRPAGEPDATEAVRARAPAGTEFAASDVLPRARAVSDAERGRPETLAGPGRPQALEPCASYRELVLYAPPRSACAIDLSDNTNAFGTPPAARSALRELELRAVSRYPSAYGDELRAALARHAGVPLEEIITGCGSDDVLDSAIRAFARPGERVAYCDPTFAMAPVFARMNGLEPVPVPLGPDFDADPDALLATGARVIYLCSPNNPTGTTISPSALERVAAEAPGLVILDQAYREFETPAGTPCPPEPPRSPRLLLVRTLSKAFGLAGLRIGYGIGARALVEAVAKSRGPFKVSAPAERAAVAALTRDLSWVAAGVRAVQHNRRCFQKALARIGLRPLPSRANFVLVPVPDARAADLAFRARGIALRPFAGLAGIGDALRITIGRRRELEPVLAAFVRLGPELGIATSGEAEHARLPEACDSPGELEPSTAAPADLETADEPGAPGGSARPATPPSQEVRA